MTLQFKSPGDAPGFYPLVRRGKQLKYLSFAVLQLGGDLRDYSFDSGEEELSIDSYTGPVAIEVESTSGVWKSQFPKRESIAQPAPMLYVPAGARVTFRATNGNARLSIAGALGARDVPPALIEGQAIMSKAVGKDNWSRNVHTHIADNVRASHLISGETINRPGGWSSCPPHKHDEFNAPAEVPMEEVYYFQVEPAQGFGFMRVYTKPDDPDAFDYSYAVEHGDTVIIPRGYHPVVACPGYTVNYTWILAGEGRTYGAWSDDPRHTWIKQA